MFKSQITSINPAFGGNKQITSTKLQNADTRVYDLEERTLSFSKTSLEILGKLPHNLGNSSLVGQAVRSITSIGANYIEANESLGKKDFALRIKISRKEAKESCYWLKLIISANLSLPLVLELEGLLDEAQQQVKILSKILENSK